MHGIGLIRGEGLILIRFEWMPGRLITIRSSSERAVIGRFAVRRLPMAMGRSVLVRDNRNVSTYGYSEIDGLQLMLHYVVQRERMMFELGTSFCECCDSQCVGLEIVDCRFVLKWSVFVVFLFPAQVNRDVSGDPERKRWER
jgi:hypothetical protein